MQCTLKWWGQHDHKPIGIEYHRFSSAPEIEAAIRSLLDAVRVQMIEIRDEAGDLLAHYPDPKTYRARGR